MEAEGAEEHRADERPQRDAQGAARHIHGHGGVALPLRDHRLSAQRTERMVGARAKPRHRRQQHQERKGGREADEGEQRRRPDETRPDEARAVAIGEPAEDGLRDGGHAAIRQAHQAHRPEGEREPVDEQWVQHG